MNRVPFPAGAKCILFAQTFTTVLPPAQRIPAFFLLGLLRPEREADHSPVSTVEVKKLRNFATSSAIRLHGLVLN
jgi:hypothetical protein